MRRLLPQAVALYSLPDTERLYRHLLPKTLSKALLACGPFSVPMPCTRVQGDGGHGFVGARARHGSSPGCAQCGTESQVFRSVSSPKRLPSDFALMVRG